MAQYLSNIKSKVDLIAAAGSPITIEDLIYYILNGLPASYQSFKTAICINLKPISIDDLYSLLCSEETLQINKALKQEAAIQITALVVNQIERKGTEGQSR